MRFAAAVLMLAGTLALSILADRRAPESLMLPLESIPASIAGWDLARAEPLTEPVLARLRPSSYLSRVYRNRDRQLGLFIAYYAQQRAGETMHSPKHCLPGSGWEIWRRGSAAIPFRGTRVEVNHFGIRNGAERLVMLYWYQSRTRIVASEYAGKILLARDALLGGHTAGSIVRVTLPDTPSAEHDGAAFTSAVMPAVQRCLGE